MRGSVCGVVLPSPPPAPHKSGLPRASHYEPDVGLYAQAELLCALPSYSKKGFIFVVFTAIHPSPLHLTELKLCLASQGSCVMCLMGAASVPCTCSRVHTRRDMVNIVPV